MNTSKIGDIAEAQALAKFLSRGYSVSVPFGDNDRYDLILDKGDGKLLRVQVKAGRLRNGAIRFALASNVYKAKSAHYHGDVDYFACVCEGEVYLVPITECGVRELALRIDPPKNNQKEKIRWAKHYIV